MLTYGMGYKSSGIERELGSYTLDAYTQTKAVHVNLAVSTSQQVVVMAEVVLPSQHEMEK